MKYLNQPRSVNVSRMETPETAVTTLDVNSLSTMVQEWCRVEGEIQTLRQQMREKQKRTKVLETLIMNVMKAHNMGALNLTSSNSRVLYDTKTSKVPLNPKNLMTLLAAHLKDEAKAKEAVDYINENRATKTREKLLFEKS